MAVLATVPCPARTPPSAPSRLQLTGVTMRSRRLHPAVLASLAWLALPPLDGPADQRPGLPVAEFRELHNQLTRASEPWQAIPWRLTLLEARAQAAKENKPVYLLVRSGHPLGCV